MLSGEFKACFSAMVEGPGLPALCVVALGAGGRFSETSQMMVINVTGSAGHALCSKTLVSMAASTSNSRMLSRQWETRQFMIEQYTLFPAINIMATGTAVA